MRPARWGLLRRHLDVSVFCWKPPILVKHSFWLFYGWVWNTILEWVWSTMFGQIRLIGKYCQEMVLGSLEHSNHQECRVTVDGQLWKDVLKSWTRTHVIDPLSSESGFGFCQYKCRRSQNISALPAVLMIWFCLCCLCNKDPLDCKGSRLHYSCSNNTSSQSTTS